jgi:hypothetical protein
MDKQQNQQDTLVAGQQYSLVPRRKSISGEWWLILAVVVTLVLLAGIAGSTIPGFNLGASNTGSISRRQFAV